MNLSGSWKYGFQQGEYIGDLNLPEVVQNKNIGEKNIEPENMRWGREYIFEGKIWFEKTIEIGESDVNKTAIISFERCHWGINLYINGEHSGYSENISSEQEFEVTGKIKLGENKITACVDNSMLYPLRNGSHHFSADTQGNWNGIIGEMKLDFYEDAYIKDIQIRTDFEWKCVRIETVIVNNDFGRVEDRHEKIRLTLSNGDVYDEWIWLFEGENLINFTMELDEFKCWSHFEPNLYTVKVEFLSQTEEKTFAFRKIETKGKHIFVNGDRVILRGSHDACVFPENGAPPMDVQSWLTVFKQYKKMGLNHFRAHSWCPPNAAFEAANIVGIYMQVEGPASGTLGQGQSVEGEIDPLKESQKTQEYIKNELLNIQKAYGSHPSFCMLSIGNELYTDFSVLADIVDILKKNDKRHLIAGGSNNNWAKPHIGENDDFFVGFMVDTWHGLFRGSYHCPDVGHINNQEPSTLTNYDEACSVINIPIITHELGQYLTYPNYAEIEKYKGAMKPYHLEYFKAVLEENGMEGMDKKFSLASGELQQRLYKEEIEANLRTQDMSGFQLLDIKDFPGQAVALCGVLDVFGDEKEYFDLKAWQNCCADVVPLLLIEKRIFEQGEKAKFEIKIANYFNKDLNESLKLNGEILLNKINAPKGKLTSLGIFELEFNSLGKQVISVSFGEYENTWEVWVFANEEKENEEDVRVTYTWDLELERFLEKGGKALYLSDGNNLRNTIPSAFQNNFWSYRMFAKHEPAGTLGMYIDSEHEIFKDFPTENHSNWQWFNIARNSNPVDIGNLPNGIKSIISPIDTYERNKKLSILFEVTVGKGRLIVSSYDFISNIEKLEAKMLYNNILRYLKNDYNCDIVVKARALDTVLKVKTDGKLWRD